MVKEPTGFERLRIALTGKRTYNCCDCDLVFHARARRRSDREFDEEAGGSAADSVGLAESAMTIDDAARELAGLIEIRGLGIRRCDFVGEAVVGLVVDLAAADAERLPPPEALQTQISGIKIPRIPVGIGFAALPLVVAALTMTASSSSSRPSADCSKGIGNHITPTIATE